MVSFTRCSTAIAFFAAFAISAVQGNDEILSRELRAQIEADFQAKMLAAVNAERAKNGLAAMCTNKKLQQAAQLHSEDMAAKNFMSHTGSNGSNFADRIKAQSFNWNGAAENVAAGQVDVASVMNSWMNSAGHKANIMGSSKFFGTGYAYSASSTYKHYWTQDFASGAGEACDSGSGATTPTTAAPTKAPTPPATQAPTVTTRAPAATTRAPAATTRAPTVAPTKAPAVAPTKAPAVAPTKAPAVAPTKAPTPPVTTQPPVTRRPRPTRRTPTARPTVAPKQPNPTIPKTDCKPIY